ncbi:glutathione S-transferase family protein [Henriciella aquimarina]|uniref:glutathione S-transferase family protein n=1 Tax=Henriciella aquimarina TaxID=545261 RepID=UPI001301FC61|nr:glutathione S-transferase family protein [Henriciella aquimarina]
MTTLYGWGPMFDCPSPSPYVMKSEIQLQMLDIEFDRAFADLDAVSKHKAPYVEDEGEIIQDSNFIRAHFERKTGRSLNDGLTPRQQALSWALERMVEGHLNAVMAGERWLNDANFEKGPTLFFADVTEPQRQAVIDEIREGMRKTRWESGIGRHAHEEQLQLAAWDLAAIAAQLGEQAFLLGDEPTVADASVSAVLVSCATPYFETPLVDLVQSHSNLPGYIRRMKECYLPEGVWPDLVMA